MACFESYVVYNFWVNTTISTFIQSIIQLINQLKRIYIASYVSNDSDVHS